MVISIKSLWQEGTELRKFPSPERDIQTDVLIIGGGITGLLTAFFLEQKGVNYTLVEKGRICSGTTANTTAKITFQHGFIYNKLLRSMGYTAAKTYLTAHKAAFEKYAELCKNTDCDYEIKDNFVYTLNDREKAEKECEALDRIGYRAKFCDGLPLPVKTAGAVCFLNQAQFNPLKFLSAISQNLNILENTSVKEMIGCTAVTDKGKIKAEKVIVTTHFPFINKHGSYSLKLYQHRSYVLALENAQQVSGMYVDESDTGLSFRNYGEYLLLGGGGHRTGKPGGNWKELRDFAELNYPQAKEKYFWAAQDCMSLDGMPYIGNYSKNTPNLYTASGFNKWGMTGAMLSAMILSDTVLDKENRYAELFSPSRSMLKPQLFINGFESVAGLLTVSEKRCPHLGCVLKWNSAEHSWDCPCHGSRFDENGKVLNNPANGNLKNK